MNRVVGGVFVGRKRVELLKRGLNYEMFMLDERWYYVSRIKG
jgi:hypothetical protein